MPEAERAHSTPARRPLPPPESVPSRRALLGATAGLLALGAAPAGAVAAPSPENPDALLIAMCARIVAASEEMERLEAPYYDTAGPPHHITERSRAWVVEGHRLSEAVAEMDAITPEGLRAKARAMMAYACYTADGAPDWANHSELLGWSLARDLLRDAPAARTAPAAHPDAGLFALCAEHGANRDAVNSADNWLSEWDDPLWLAYARTRDAISAARPRTMEGVLAKARAAKGEAGGENYPEACPASDWAWDVLNDLLRLNGRA